MTETVESVMEYGILTPAIVRPRREGGYEIVAGHRRKRACELAGLDALPSIVREMDDDMATILMVDSNIQREDVPPSEKARAFRMKLEALKRQGSRTDLTSPQVAAKFRADDEVARDAGISGDTVRRYIRLTELSPQLQQMVDDKKIAMTPAVELSHLKPEEQQMVVDAISKRQTAPSLSQAQQLKKLSQAGELNKEAMRSVMTEKREPGRAASPKSDVGQPRPSHRPPPSPVQQDTPKEVEAAAPEAETPPPFKLGDTCYATIKESVKALKDTEKDCSCTPDIFLATITEFVKRFHGEISCYTGEYYAPVFPALSPVQLRYLRQQMDAIRDAADQLYILVERKNENE